MKINEQRLSDFVCKRCGEYRIEVLVASEAKGGSTYALLPCAAKGCGAGTNEVKYV